jgi:hypothetical protein
MSCKESRTSPVCPLLRISFSWNETTRLPSVVKDKKEEDCVSAFLLRDLRENQAKRERRCSKQEIPDKDAYSSFRLSSSSSDVCCVTFYSYFFLLIVFVDSVCLYLRLHKSMKCVLSWDISHWIISWLPHSRLLYLDYNCQCLIRVDRREKQELVSYFITAWGASVFFNTVPLLSVSSKYESMCLTSFEFFRLQFHRQRLLLTWFACKHPCDSDVRLSICLLFRCFFGFLRDSWTESNVSCMSSFNEVDMTVTFTWLVCLLTSPVAFQKEMTFWRVIFFL